MIVLLLLCFLLCSIMLLLWMISLFEMVQCLCVSSMMLCMLCVLGVCVFIVLMVCWMCVWLLLLVEGVSIMWMGSEVGVGSVMLLLWQLVCEKFGIICWVCVLLCLWYMLQCNWLLLFSVISGVFVVVLMGWVKNVVELGLFVVCSIVGVYVVKVIRVSVVILWDGGNGCIWVVLFVNGQVLMVVMYCGVLVGIVGLIVCWFVSGVWQFQD